MSNPVVVATPTDMQRWSRGHRAAGRRIALVPTMGALHAGHLELIRQAHSVGDVVVVSIFVNPLQFNRSDDFDAYPRPLDTDLDACRLAGVDAVYAPGERAMYPTGFQTHVVPGALAQHLEGEFRPGHFEGVTTVVAKLFGAVAPDVAVFGTKDYQQLAIVRRMVRDLDMGLEIVGVPTVREHDDLAMSSRNRLLTEHDRAAAVCIPQMLAALDTAVRAGQTSVSELVELGRDLLAREPRARVEYLSIVEPDTLEEMQTVGPRAVALVAAWFGSVRLIDNRELTAPADARG